MKHSESRKTIERIRSDYEEQTPTKTEKLKILDKKVRKPAIVFACVFGTASVLLFGFGMSLALKATNPNLHPAISVALGVAVGAVGIASCVVNYFFYKAILNGRKKKYEAEILRLCDEALNEAE